MSVGCLGYLGFSVRDTEAWDAFMTNVLGLMPGEPANGAKRYRMDAQAWRISLAMGDEDDLAFAGFEVAGSEELDAMSRRLADAGVAVGNGDPELLAQRGVVGLISCHDPEGLPVEIYYGPTLRTETPFTSPAGISAFVTGEQGLGHMVLSARDIGEVRKFYQDLLGFRLSDLIRMQVGPGVECDLEFYHCNARHHTLALVPIPMQKRMHHFMIQVPTLDAVGYALERAQAMETPITATLGRHTNDQMVSFYVGTPSGFEVEFGFDALEVDDATWHVTRHDKPSSWGHKRPVPIS